MTQTTLINFYPKEYTQGLCYDPFAVNLERCVASFNALNMFQTKQLI